MRSIFMWSLMLLSGVASAQTESQAYFACGTSACAGISQPYLPLASTAIGGYTGINDLNVGGDYFDVAFEFTQPTSSPFVLSSTAAAPGQPLTGIDAATALEIFYTNLQPPFGPSGYSIPRDAGPFIITAFGPSGPLSSDYQGSTELLDVVQTYVGGGYSPAGFSSAVALVGNIGYLPANANNGPYNDNNAGVVVYTTWTAVAAPEVDPNFAGSGLALLIGGVAVLRGRRLIGARGVH